ncbi:hypothetical protein Cni_G14398 [Canna indica]|uniref:Reverse transcriptase domain-containing protein n=1 Tax=Canna indica TaxID=4628 RepID=A0AAQ3QCD0_9LILI|nr:hypothetical protein Cni_G14398 [Canna indica]
MEQLLSLMLDEAVKNRKIIPFKVGEVTLSHTFYANDIVIFIKGNQKTCKNLMNAINEYCLLTGQKLNFEKSSVIFSVKYKSETKHRISQLLNVKEEKYSIKYMGSYIAPKKLEKSYQSKLVQKVKCRIDSWASNQLSQAEKSIMINSVVSSIPSYSLMCSWVSEEAVKEIIKVEKKFF